MRQIKSFLEQTFFAEVDMNDWGKKSADSRELTFLSRSLAAFSIMHLTDTTAEEASASIVDGGKDNGIDAIFYDRREHILYLVQSKWKQNGSGSFEKGELQKFICGVKDLINEKFDKFNKKIQNKADEIDEALNDSDTRIMLILSYTGKDPLSSEVRQDLEDFVRDINDATDLMFFKVFDQKYIYYAVAQDSKGTPINIEVMLYEWGQTREPYQSFYGQVFVAELATWWEKFNTKLFTPNIRTYLGETDVNNGIIETLKKSPEKFWYYNNGVTALCSSIRKKPIGGASRDSGVFECKDVRIVNGAQTVGSVARASTLYPDSVQQAKVFIRFISLENCPEDFDREVTRSNNTQNRIDSRDFIALDPEQERIRNELRLEEVSYAYKSGEIAQLREKGFEIEEATLARACSFNDVTYAVLAKGKISKLWEDIEKAPYKALFNGGVTGPALWRVVQIMRLISEQLDKEKLERRKNKEHLYLVHGNLFITHVVFQHLPENLVKSLDDVTEDDAKLIQKTTLRILDSVISSINTLFPDVYAANLFKNLKKCRELLNLTINNLS
jgi:hypothetical protein